MENSSWQTFPQDARLRLEAELAERFGAVRCVAKETLFSEESRAFSGDPQGGGADALVLDCAFDRRGLFSLKLSFETRIAGQRVGYVAREFTWVLGFWRCNYDFDDP